MWDSEPKVVCVDPPRITVEEHDGGFEVWLDALDANEDGACGACLGQGKTLDEALTCAEDDLEEALDEVRELRGLRPKAYGSFRGSN